MNSRNQMESKKKRRRQTQSMRTRDQRGTKRWVTLWSFLLIGIAAILCGVVLQQGSGISGSKTASSAAAFGTGDTSSKKKNSSVGSFEDGTAAASADSSEADSVASDASEDPSERSTETAPLITIHNPTENAADEDGSGKADGSSEEEQGHADTASAQQDIVHLLFAGDVYLSDHVQEAYDAAGGIAGVVSDGYRQDIQSADYFMVNEEFPFSMRGTPAEDKQFTFRVQPKKVKLLQEIGIDLVTLANNHALDYGRDALLDTMDTLDQAGIAHVGAGENLDEARKPLVVELKGKRFAFIGATRVIPEADWAAGSAWPGMFSAYDGGDALSEEIKEAKQQADYVIVYVHWGIEREETPNEVQTTLAHRLVDAGADLVIGAHPHVLQGLEYYKGVPIAYSLGNFVFGSSIPSTALLKADVSEQGIQLQLVPGTSAAGYTRKLEDAEKISAFYEKMQNLSIGVRIDATGRIHAE